MVNTVNDVIQFYIENRENPQILNTELHSDTYGYH